MAVVVLVVLAIVVAAMVTAAHSRDDVPRPHAEPRELVRRALTVVPIHGGELPRHLIDRIVETDPRVDVAIVAVGSPARSALERLTPRVTRLHRTGVTTADEALRAGAAWGMRQGYDAIIEMPAEHPQLACATTALLEALDDGAHVAVGSRHVPGSRIVGCARRRRLLSRYANRALRYLTRVPLHDVTARLRAYRWEAVEYGLARARGRRRAFALEVLLHCRHAGLRFAEVPVVATGVICAITALPDARAALYEALHWRSSGTMLGRPSVRALLRPIATVLGVR